LVPCGGERNGEKVGIPDAATPREGDFLAADSQAEAVIARHREGPVAGGRYGNLPIEDDDEIIRSAGREWEVCVEVAAVAEIDERRGLKRQPGPVPCQGGERAVQALKSVSGKVGGGSETGHHSRWRSSRRYSDVVGSKTVDHNRFIELDDDRVNGLSEGAGGGLADDPGTGIVEEDGSDEDIVGGLAVASILILV